MAVPRDDEPATGPDLDSIQVERALLTELGDIGVNGTDESNENGGVGRRRGPLGCPARLDEHGERDEDEHRSHEDDCSTLYNVGRRSFVPSPENKAS